MIAVSILVWCLVRFFIEHIDQASVNGSKIFVSNNQQRFLIFLSVQNTYDCPIISSHGMVEGK